MRLYVNYLDPLRSGDATGMKASFKVLPPSRRNKKQITAHLKPVLVEAVHRRRLRAGVTVQEIIASAVNTAMESFGRRPVLPVDRRRLVKRERHLAQVQISGNAPRSRAGTRRIAAWFDKDLVDRVVAFSIEVGTRIEDLIELGLREMFTSEELEEAEAAEKTSQEAAEKDQKAA